MNRSESVRGGIPRLGKSKVCNLRSSSDLSTLSVLLPLQISRSSFPLVVPSKVPVGPCYRSPQTFYLVFLRVLPLVRFDTSAVERGSEPPDVSDRPKTEPHQLHAIENNE